MEAGYIFRDIFEERYRHCAFLYAKKEYKVVDLNLEKKNGPPYLLINILTFEYDMKITYDEKIFKVLSENYMCKRYQESSSQKNTFLQIISVGFSDMVWKLFESLMNLTND